MPGGRRGNGEGSIYQREDGRWFASITRDDGRRLTRSAKTRREAVVKLDQLRHDLAVGLPALPQGQTVEAYLTYWLRDVKAGLKPESRRLYQGLIDRLIVPAIGRVRLGELTPPHIYHLLSSAAKAGQGAGAQRLIHAILRGALNQAMREGLVGRNVCTLVPAPEAPASPGRPLDLDEAKRLLAVAAQHRLGALVVVGVTLGLRNGEVRALRWADHPRVRTTAGPVSPVDLEAGRIVVGAQLQPRRGEGLVAVEPKSKESRRVLGLPPGLTAVLRRHRAQQAAERLAAGGMWADLGYVFATRRGTPYTFSTPLAVVRELCQAAELPTMRYHDLRHTAATLLLNTEGIDMHTVSWNLGHANVSITVDLYGKAQERHTRQVAMRMEELLWGASDG